MKAARLVIGLSVWNLPISKSRCGAGVHKAFRFPGHAVHNSACKVPVGAVFFPQPFRQGLGGLFALWAAHIPSIVHPQGLFEGGNVEGVHPPNIRRVVIYSSLILQHHTVPNAPGTFGIGWTTDLRPAALM